jgi:hypothetical protein
MLYHSYLKSGIVYVPIVAKTEAGFYMNREPVSVVAATNTEGLRYALRDAMEKGNPTIPTPARNAFPRPVLLKYSGAKTWSAFARGASQWSIEEKEGTYQIVGYRTHPDGYWVQDPDQRTELPAGSTRDQAIDAMIAILQDAARK